MVVVSLDRAVGFPLPAVITAASLKNPLGLSGGVLIQPGCVTALLTGNTVPRGHKKVV